MRKRKGTSPGKGKVEPELAAARKSLRREITRRRELEKRLTEALEQQTATSEILRVISRSPTDVRPVFDTIVQSARRLCEADSAGILTYDGEMIGLESLNNANPEQAGALRQAYPMPANRGHATGRAILTGLPVHIPDVREDPDYALDALRDAVGLRCVLSVPMVRDGNPIGAITLQRWGKSRPFSDKQIALLETFAGQAVIAIENGRLFRELGDRNRDLMETLEQQTATGEILRVISRSPTDIQPIFDTIVKSAAKLCNADVSNVTRFDGELVHMAAMHAAPAGAERLSRFYPARPSGALASLRSIRDRKVVHIPDLLVDAEYSVAEPAIAAGFRAVLSVPLLREGRAIGSLTVGRATAGHFSDMEVALLQTFADQAVIAVENVRLFTELTETLAGQTATGEVLRATIRAQTDAQPVFDIIADSALRLCGAGYGQVAVYDGEWLQLAALRDVSPEGVEALRRRFPVRPDHGTAMGRAVQTRAVVQIPDVLEDPGYTFKGELVTMGFRSILVVPMLLKGEPTGGIAVGRREPGPFSAKQIELLRTFADQAVIAVENVRLFKELEARTRE